MKKFLLVVAAAVAAYLVASSVPDAKDAKINVNFIGEWCSQNPNDPASDAYALPSSKSDGICKNIAGFAEHEFWTEYVTCHVLEASKAVEECGHTGCGYSQTITASCSFIGPGKDPTKKFGRRLELSRYKWSLEIKDIGGN